MNNIRFKFKYKNNTYLWLGGKEFRFLAGVKGRSVQYVNPDMIDTLYAYVMREIN